jgi:type II secretory pathway pseudopilin PulG
MSTGAIVAIVLGCVFGGIFVIGVLAAVAIPAFMKNSRKAKGIESTMNVKRMYDGARMYYEESRMENGEGQFPVTPAVSTVPALGACCEAPGRKCAPDPSLWTDPTWQALRFSMDDPHYYSYRYEAEGKGATAQFSAGAHGDLDCDGVYSTFEMVGGVRPDGTVTGAAGMFRDRELE